MTRLRASELEALLAFLGEARSVEGPRPFTTELLDRLAELVPCEYVSYQETDLARGVAAAYAGSSAEEDESFDDPRAISDDDMAIHNACATLTFRRRHGDAAAILAWSDLFDRDRRVHDDIEPWSREYGIVDHASIPLEASVVRKVWVSFASCERDFDARDHRILELLQPHLSALHREAAFRRRLHVSLVALERAAGDTCGVVLFGSTGQLEYASPFARELLEAYVGDVDGRLVERLAEFPARRAGRQLVAEAIGAAVLLREEPALAAPLTAREWDVMRCVAAGRKNAEIAELLWITPGTVRKHLENVYGKLGVRSRTAALARLPARLV